MYLYLVTLLGTKNYEDADIYTYRYGIVADSPEGAISQVADIFLLEDDMNKIVKIKARKVDYIKV